MQQKIVWNIFYDKTLFISRRHCNDDSYLYGLAAQAHGLSP